MAVPSVGASRQCHLKHFLGPCPVNTESCCSETGEGKGNIHAEQENSVHTEIELSGLVRGVSDRCGSVDAVLVLVRYPDGGGLTSEGRARREAVRLRAAELFVQDVPVPEIARRLRVSHNAVYAWRRRWRADGDAGLTSKGPSGADCRLAPGQQDRRP